MNVSILQGSVATRLICSVIFSDDFTANVLLSVTVKEFLKNQSIFREIMTKTYWLTSLLDHALHYLRTKQQYTTLSGLCRRT